MREACDGARARGLRVGFVPTMGALHEGHLRLLDEARRRADFVALSIFVNPLQFGPKEDLARYPRTFDADVTNARERGVDVVFAPHAEELYPPAFSTKVRVEGVTEVLEASFRPGHFEGVTTVVTKLLNIVGPCTAIFGRKDYQQWKVVERLARDLDLPAEIIGHPTVREPDGLALSSRNRYLAPEERVRALGISRGLREASRLFDGGERRARILEEAVREQVVATFDRVDYVSIADPETLQPVEAAAGERALIAVAAHLGKTRLIDNAVLGEDRL